MRIEGFRTTGGEGGVRTEAGVTWEDSERPPQTIFFEVPAGGSDDGVDPNAYLAAAAIPAFRHGERRIAVDGAVCPRLRDGIAAAAALLGAWNRHRAAAPVVEPARGFVAPRPALRRRSAIMASGGIDSTYSILTNRRDLPPGHPLAFRTALRVRDLVFPADSPPERRAHVDVRSARAVSILAAASGLETVEISTNAMALENDFEGHLHWAHGSLLAACGIAAASGLTDVTISASHDSATGVLPWGSHPLIDEQFATAAVAIHHQGIERSRLRKTAEIARWPPALDALFVCGQGPLPGDVLNCGSCEKCIRTRVGLLVAAGIEEPPTFPPGRLTAETIDAVSPLEGFRRLAYYWAELADGSRSAGRPELGAAIDRLILRQKAHDRWSRAGGWKGSLRRLDARYFGGVLLRLRRRRFPK